MSQAIKEAMQQAIESPKGQGLAATFTTMSGLGTVLELLTPVLGAVATMAGLTLTWVMIGNGRRKRRMDAESFKLSSEKQRLEIEVLEKKLDGSDARLMRKTIKDTVENAIGRRRDDVKDS
ncbi:hypothetical protein KAR91_54730 [Candidatus Pacearchaeota archaeon]|nr:hypothetical protein [Candidatus Pacearchaeota archaeon]